MAMNGNVTFKHDVNGRDRHGGTVTYQKKVHAVDHDTGLDMQRSLIQQMRACLQEDLNDLTALQEELDRRAGHG